MTIIHNPTSPLGLSQKLALSIGTFDGVHLGHQALLQRLIQVSQERKIPSAIVTYDNHPYQVLHPEEPFPLICTPNHKIELLNNYPIDYIILFTFNHTFANQTAEHFLQHMQSISPFSYLNMGYDGRLGKNRSGDKEHLQTLSKSFHFTLEYMPPFSIKDEVVSSTAIREYIKQGTLEKASNLLGRPYSISGHVVSGRRLGRTIGFPTANLLIHNTITPPAGVWEVAAIWEGHKRRAVANLGYAPTVNENREQLLEVHIPNYEGDLYGKMLEVVFKRYIRPEMKFASIDALKEQLKKDVSSI